ncbi:MAG: T9SS type A sorting domain-containing protein [Rhodothermales bacterium]
MRHLLIHTLLLLFALPLAAQDTIQPDTLDWHGYYPLEIGNVWELRFDGAFLNLVRRQRIEADTLVAGHRWFVQTEFVGGVEFGQDVARYDTLLLRYDEPYGRVLARRPANGEEWDYTCDLSGDFGAEVSCGADLDEYVYSVPFEGGYVTDPNYDYPLVVGDDTIAFAAVKGSRVTGGSGLIGYYHGVGPLPTWGDDGYGGTIAFSYLRLGGVEYGKATAFVGIEEVPERVPPHVSVYPNPAREKLWIEAGEGVRSISLYDSQGRLGLRRGACGSPCKVDLGALAPGVYGVEVELESGELVRRGVVVR